MCNNQDHPALSILKDCLAREAGRNSWHSQRMAADLGEAIALILSPKPSVTREWVYDLMYISDNYQNNNPQRDYEIAVEKLREVGVEVEP